MEATANGLCEEAASTARVKEVASSPIPELPALRRTWKRLSNAALAFSAAASVLCFLGVLGFGAACLMLAVAGFILAERVSARMNRLNDEWWKSLAEEMNVYTADYHRLAVQRMEVRERLTELSVELLSLASRDDTPVRLGVALANESMNVAQICAELRVPTQLQKEKMALASAGEAAQDSVVRH